MNIVLIGYRCSGKTAIGKMLGRELQRGFIDTDVLIEEKAGCSIEMIVFRHGWDYFRDIEKQVVKGISVKNNLVIATGGGVVTNKENVNNLKKNGWIIWLKGESEILKARMDNEQKSKRVRPSLTGADPLGEIKQVLKVRTPLYRKAADLVVDTTTLSLRKVASLIINTLSQGLQG